MSWQPIETAPRDGTSIIAWCLFEDTCESGGPVVVSWCHRGVESYDPRTGKTTDVYAFYDGCRAPQGLTHWMPIPAKPEISKERQKACSGYFDPHKVYPR